jgi:phosphoesterase RecJ-like protein
VWQQVINLINSRHSFVITAHVNPDCDALGSELALAEHLTALGKQVAIINSDQTPPAFRFLDPKKIIRRYSPKRHNPQITQAEVIVVLDASGGWSRLGAIGDILEKTNAFKLCIDHHPDATEFVDLAVVDTTAAATSELIFELIEAMGGKPSTNMAQALYAAIVTDSGSFRFPNTSPTTHRITARLLEAGADPSHIYTEIYEQNSLGAVRLRGHVMDSIQLTAGGQIAYYGLAKKNLKDYGVKPLELDGFASLGQEIAGVKVTVYCLEASQGKVKVSLRSDGSVAINQIAQIYGGGGHAGAAGALVSGQLNNVLSEVLDRVRQLLAEDGKTES